MNESLDPSEWLAGRVIVVAVKDARNNRPCTQHGCRDHGHRCRRDAVQFLRSPWATIVMEVARLSERTQERLMQEARA